MKYKLITFICLFSLLGCYSKNHVFISTSSDIKIELNKKKRAYKISGKRNVHMLGDIWLNQIGQYQVRDDTLYFFPEKIYDTLLFESAFLEKHVDTIPANEVLFHFTRGDIPDSLFYPKFNYVLVNPTQYYHSSNTFGLKNYVMDLMVSIKIDSLKSFSLFGRDFATPIYRLKQETTNYIKCDMDVLGEAGFYKEKYEYFFCSKVLLIQDSLFFTWPIETAIR